MSSGARHPHLWYPFTSVEAASAPPKVVSGSGAWLHLADGRKVLDCISSWWVNLHGHGHPAIAAAIHAQAETLEHVIFAGFTHEPAERLAEALVDLLPPPLSRVFFSDDGSTAVEVAVKMACQYWRNRGEERTTFVSFEGGYHGDTFGAMSVGARSLFTEAFGGLLFGVESVPFPETWIGDDGVADREEAALARLEVLLARPDRPVAAVIVEPLVQGAGGMRMCRAAFLGEVRRATREAGVLLILDEVMTGFGRTGDWFACRKAEIAPDLICLAKGLTGGFVPLAATVATEAVYEAFRGAEPDRTFWHGHSYTANPIGCAAALASLELLRENAPAFQEMESHHRAFLASLDPAAVSRRRVTGTIAAMDLRTDEATGYLNRVGDAVKALTLDRGLLLRPLGNTLYLMPPYCLSHEERTGMYRGVQALLDDVL